LRKPSKEKTKKKIKVDGGKTRKKKKRSNARRFHGRTVVTMGKAKKKIANAPHWTSTGNRKR